MKQNPSEILKIYQTNSEQLSLKEIFEDLKHISEIKKCSFCGCNKDTLKEFAELADANNEKELAEKNKWPIERGSYFVGDEKASVAINTLSNTELPKELIKTLKDKIAIVGYCETENIGVEKIVKNIISNPNIRTLIICGNESGQNMMGGHFSGQALLSLHTNGINEKKRIIGAKGKRPVVKNINKEQVERFQSQIEIIELIGNNSIDDISQNVTIALSKEKQKFSDFQVMKLLHKILKNCC